MRRGPRGRATAIFPSSAAPAAPWGAACATRCLGIAKGIGRTVAAFQAHLMGAMAFRPIDEEALVEPDAAVLAGIELHHPAVDAVGIELGVDRAIKRVGEI